MQGIRDQVIVLRRGPFKEFTWDIPESLEATRFLRDLDLVNNQALDAALAAINNPETATRTVLCHAVNLVHRFHPSHHVGQWGMDP